MLLDWFTVGAQALNFIILVALMRRFLYKPILHAIDERERQVAATLADATAKESAAKRARDEFAGKNAAFDEARAGLLRAATDEAASERKRLLAEARAAASALQDQRMEALRRDARRLNQAIVRQTQDEVFAIARRALSELATTTLEAQVAGVFTRRLGAMDGAARGDLAAALQPGSAPAVIRSAFELPAEERAALQGALNQFASAEVELRFERAPALVSGIELTAGGQTFAWSLGDYLAGLERGIGELLKDEAAGTRAAPASEAEAAVNGETTNREGVKAEVENGETANGETMNAEVENTETVKAGPAKAEPAKAGPAKVAAEKPGPAKVAAEKAGPAPAPGGP